MNRILLTLSLSLYFVFATYSQTKDSFGSLTEAERAFTIYEKDTSANAVVLFEKGDDYFEVIDRRIKLVKKYHVKIKLLNEKGFEEANISIPYYHTKSSGEYVKDIQAITHNGTKKIHLDKDQIFTVDDNERWSEKRFTFPAVQKGSILEYSYTLISPFIFNLDGWNFQTNIPKLYSEFNAKIPSNYVYNRALVGFLKLDVNDSNLKEDCFYVDGYPEPADCEVLKYAMNDIPAFKEEEGFMLASSNYISRLDFELSEMYMLSGGVDKFTKTWKAVDQEFKTDKDIGRQLTKKGFFEKNVPESLLNERDELTRAKNIYAFVQNHFTWNQKYGIYRNINVKNAFDEHIGNIGEINISLLNLLNAAGIKSNMMLLSTRQNGLPKKIYPVMSDFNYIIAKIEIDGKDYLLDASDKHVTFGMLPFRALNHYGRVMDFKNDSYWYDIRPEPNNKHQVRAQLKFDTELNKGFGIFDVVNTGYNAVHTRKILNEYGEDEYVNSVEEDIEGDFSITSYELRKEFCSDLQVSQRFEYELENVLNGEMVYLNPFLIRFFEKNPFLLDERNYPVDFGYPRDYKYSVNISVPDGYAVHELPEKKAVQLGDKLVAFQFLHDQNANQIRLSFDLTLNGTYIKAEDYLSLKDVFKYVTNIQNNSLVIFKKI